MKLPFEFLVGKEAKEFEEKLKTLFLFLKKNLNEQSKFILKLKGS